MTNELVPVDVLSLMHDAATSINKLIANLEEIKKNFSGHTKIFMTTMGTGIHPLVRAQIIDVPFPDSSVCPCVVFFTPSAIAHTKKEKRSRANKDT